MSFKALIAWIHQCKPPTNLPWIHERHVHFFSVTKNQNILRDCSLHSLGCWSWVRAGHGRFYLTESWFQCLTSLGRQRKNSQRTFNPVMRESSKIFRRVQYGTATQDGHLDWVPTRARELTDAPLLLPDPDDTRELRSERASAFKDMEGAQACGECLAASEECVVARVGALVAGEGVASPAATLARLACARAVRLDRSSPRGVLPPWGSRSRSCSRSSSPSGRCVF